MEVEAQINAEGEIQPSLHTLCLRSKKRTLDLFMDNYISSGGASPVDEKSLKIKLSSKISDEYGPVKDLPPPQQPGAKSASTPKTKASKQEMSPPATKSTPSTSTIPSMQKEISSMLPPPKTQASSAQSTTSQALVVVNPNQNAIVKKAEQQQVPISPAKSRALALNNPYALEKPQWHAPWKLHRVISGHLGWVRAITVDPANEWFVTGSADRTIKVCMSACKHEVNVTVLLVLPLLLTIIVII